MLHFTPKTLVLRSRWATLCLLALGSVAGTAFGGPPDEKAVKAGDEPASIGASTLGGMQFWSDELVFHAWRIQRHVYTGHCRLLDDRDKRRQSGTFADCQDALEKAKRKQELPPLSRKVVLTLHGLIRSRGVMEPLGEYVSKNSDYEVLHVGYPSTRADLATHAASLASVMKHLEGVEEINFVAHSLGNLVIRRYLAEQTDVTAGKRPDPRIKRIVMLGPPNNGAQIAVAFKDNPLLGLVWGKSAKELAVEWEHVSQKLAVPECEFGIIAGNSGFNPLVKGEHDFVVSVEETKLIGARDFLVLPVAHNMLNSDPKVQASVLKFVEQGYFVSPEARQPITKDVLRAAKQP